MNKFMNIRLNILRKNQIGNNIKTNEINDIIWCIGFKKDGWLKFNIRDKKFFIKSRVFLLIKNKIFFAIVSLLFNNLLFSI